MTMKRSQARSAEWPATLRSASRPDGGRSTSRSGSHPLLGPTRWPRRRAGSQRAAPGERVLTLFTSPKPFDGHIDVIQRNALRSWRLLPGCEVIIFGDEHGSAEMAREIEARHVPGVALSAAGTPI